METGDEASLPVLVIDDDVETREALAALLAMYGYPVVVAADGDEAIARLRGGLQPGLILLDLMMPSRDGCGFRELQQQDPRLAVVPVVVCSGRHDIERKATLMGAVAFCRKPVDWTRLHQLVETHRLRRRPPSISSAA